MFLRFTKHFYLKAFCTLLTVPSSAIVRDYFIVFNVDMRNVDVEPIEKHAHIEPHPCNCFMTVPSELRVSVIKMSYYNTIISQISKIYSRNTDNDRRRLCTIKHSRQTCESRKSTNQSSMSFKCHRSLTVS